MLTKNEKYILDRLIQRGWTDEIRKACAAKLIRQWQSVMRGDFMTAREFIEALQSYCRQEIGTTYYANKLSYKGVCILEKVRHIEKHFSRHFESDGTIALSGLYERRNAGYRYHCYLTISWLDEPAIKPLPKRPDWSGLEQQADEYLPEELKSTNIRLYSDSREDHTWLQGIQDERSKQEEHEQMQEQLQQLKNKYKRDKK